jgi:hypothetical protein
MRPSTYQKFSSPASRNEEKQNTTHADQNKTKPKKRARLYEGSYKKKRTRIHHEASAFAKEGSMIYKFV